MACVKCSKKKLEAEARRPKLYDAEDLLIIDTDNSIRNFFADDWQAPIKLLVFIPKAFTPVCTTEIGAMNDWYDEFKKLDCELILCSSDLPTMLVDWFDSEELLTVRKYKTISSYQLPANIGLIQDGRPKRSSVFITPDEVVVQEHFDKVGRSFAELHRMLYGYTTDNYCAEGWHSPADGFLTPPE